MAESNAPEHQDRALFGLIGKKKEEAAHQQHPSGVDAQGYGHAGDVHPVPPPGTHQQQQYSSGVDPHGYGHAGDIHPTSHVHFEEPKYHGEGEKIPHEGRIGGNLNRNNSSSSSSSSDEGGEKGEKKKKKGGLKEKLAGHKKEGEVQGEKKEGEQHHAPATATYGHTEESAEKKGLIDKIKEKLPGHQKEEEKGQY